MTTLLAVALLCASITWDPVEVDIEGNPETVNASECELLGGTDEQGVPAGVLRSGSGGVTACDLEPLLAGLDPGSYLFRVRVSDASGNLSLPSEISIAVFLRGDANSDGEVNIADPIKLLVAFFSGGALTCLDAADANDDGAVDIADPIRILLAMFASAGIPEPFQAVGGDVTVDAIGCFEVAP